MDGNPIQTNFTAGEISPYLGGRVDFNRYANGVKQLQNFIVKPQGGVIFRPGSRFVNEVKSSAAFTMLRRFVFSANQAYMLEFGNNYIRFIKNGAQVVVISTPVEVVTPYSTADLTKLSFYQSADVLVISHPNYPPQILSRFSDTSWTLQPIQFSDGPYQSSVETAQLTVSSITSTSTATATAATFGTAPVLTISGIANGPVISGVGSITLTVTAHGFSVGNQITVFGLRVFDNNGIERTDFEILPYGNGGSYTVRQTTTNTITITGTQSTIGQYIPAITVYNGVSFTTPYANWTYNVVNAKVSLTQNSGNFIEYRYANQWRLAKILSILSTTVASVTIQNNIKLDVSDSVNLTVSGTTMTSNFSGVFSFSDVGFYVRTSPGNTGSWWLITGYTNDSTVTVSQATTVAYSYPTVLVSVGTTDGVGKANVTAVVKSNVARFSSDDVGRKIRLNFGATQVFGFIASFTSTTQISVSLNDTPPIDPNNASTQQTYNNGIATSWKIGAWGNTNGYPSSVTSHDNRLWFASSTLEPQTLWGSKSGDYYNFAPTNLDSTVSDDSAITETLVSSQVNPILWMSSGMVLIVGTTLGEWRIQPSTLGASLTPTNFDAKQQSSWGSIAGIEPIRVGVSLLFMQRGGKKLREMTYAFQYDSFESRDLTVVSEHIIRVNGYAVASSFQQEPSQLYWVITNTGALSCLTYQKDQEVIAWHNHTIGGNGKVESIQSIPSIDGTYDTLYMIVNRTINGSTKRYIEYIEAEFWPSTPTDFTSLYFVDCGLSYSGSAVSSVSGLSYLNGATVSVVADGSYRGEHIVSGGAVNFTGGAATKISVGFGYTGFGQILPIEAGSEQGTAQGKVKRLTRFNLRVLNSLGFSHGEDLTKLEPVSFRATNAPMDAPPQLFSGDVQKTYNGGYNKSATFFFKQDKPYPLSILAIMPQLETYK